MSRAYINYPRLTLRYSALLFLALCGLASIGTALGAPKAKLKTPEEIREQFFMERARQVNRINREIKEASDLSLEEERELRSTYAPLTMTQEQIKLEIEDADKDPDEKNLPDQDDSDLEDPKASASASKKPEKKEAPAPIGSSGGHSTALPGQAESEVIVYPGKKRK